MSLNGEPSEGNRIPSLVNLCQRVASAHVDSICSLGDDVPIELVKPILQNCSAETLLRLEHTSPSLTNDTSALWQALCFRAYPLAAEQHYTDADPESWRDAYFELQDLEKTRLEAVGNKLRSQREELEQRRKDSQVKFTDRVPPAKRSRGWGATQPRTLIQKTRSDAVKMQKGIYGARIPVSPIKNLRVCTTYSAKMSRSPASATSSSSSNTSGTRVTVTAVPRKPSSPPKPPVKSLSSIAGAPSKPVFSAPTATFASTRPASVSPSLSRMNQPAQSPEQTRPLPLKPPTVRKGPMATIFMPKHRSYSQLPTTAADIRSRA